MSEYPPRRSFFPGRWQPLHAGHVALIRTALGEGRQVEVGIMDTPASERNPYTLAERRAMFRAEFKHELNNGLMTLRTMAWIDEVVYGRDCGWRTRHIQLGAATEAINGTELRERA